MKTVITPQFPYNRFTDSNGLFIGEISGRAEYTSKGVIMKFYWVFNDVHNKSIEVTPTFNSKNCIQSIALVGTEDRINYASRFMKPGSL